MSSWLIWGRSRLVRISSELVEDLDLARFCRRLETSYVDWWLIDRRRLKRELRKLPKLRAASRARFEAEAQNSCLYYRRSTVAMAQVILDDLIQGELTPGVKARLLRWWDQANKRAIQPVPDMLGPPRH